MNKKQAPPIEETEAPHELHGTGGQPMPLDQEVGDLPPTPAAATSGNQLLIIGLMGLGFLVALAWVIWYLLYARTTRDQYYQNTPEPTQLEQEREADLPESTSDAESLRIGPAAQNITKTEAEEESVDLSSIHVELTNGMELLVIDPEGNRTGSDGEGSYEEIPNTFYGRDLPTSKAAASIARSAANNELEITKPESGVYKFLISAKRPGTYALTIYVYDRNGNDLLLEETVLLSEGETKEFVFEYNKSADNFVAELSEVE